MEEDDIQPPHTVTREYKLRVPVLKRLCKNCGLDYVQHIDKKCLFDSSDYVPGKTTTQMSYVKVPVACSRCGGTKIDPEHVGACGSCST